MMQYRLAKKIVSPGWDSTAPADLVPFLLVILRIVSPSQETISPAWERTPVRVSVVVLAMVLR